MGHGVDVEQLKELDLSKLVVKPSILDQQEITKDWWAELNPKEDVQIPTLVIKKFMVLHHLVTDLESAEKVITRFIGKQDTLDYDEFYMLFCKGIFRQALLDMLQNIDELTKDQKDLPLALKLGAYRRSLMLAGLDKSESELKKKGKSILYALQILK